jgi:hypothetical protein
MNIFVRNVFEFQNPLFHVIPVVIILHTLIGNDKSLDYQSCCITSYITPNLLIKKWKGKFRKIETLCAWRLRVRIRSYRAFKKMPWIKVTYLPIGIDIIINEFFLEVLSTTSPIMFHIMNKEGCGIDSTSICRLVLLTNFAGVFVWVFVLIE